jgi:hypothetical protein
MNPPRAASAGNGAMKSYELHTAEDREAVFARLSPRIWLENDLARTWVVADPALVLKLLRHPMLVIASRAGILEVLAGQHGLHFPAVSYACRVLPVFVQDASHTDIRKGFATYLAARLLDLKPHLAEFCRASLHRLRHKGQVDIASEVIDPLVRKILSVLLKAEVPAEVPSLNLIDAIFFNTTVSGLTSLDARIGQALSFLRATGGDENEIAWKFISLVFGDYSLAATLTESVVKALREHDRRSDEGARLPDFPIETGVPVTLRVVTSDFAIDGVEFRSGDIVRLQLQSLGYSGSSEDQQFIFGAGRHSCIGKQMSLRVWQTFKQEFDALKLKARVTRYETVPSHFVILHKAVKVDVF